MTGAPRPSDPTRPATFRQTAAAVLWSFLGIRRQRESEKDMRLNPVHVIILGLIGAALFVAALLTIVSLIMRQA